MKTRRRYRRPRPRHRSSSSRRRRRHYGGNLTTPDQLQQAREHTSEVAHQQTMQPINNFIANTQTLAHNFITNLSNKIGIDATNLTDPQNMAILKTKIHSAAETGAELLEAADPFIQPLVDKTITEGEKAASKIGEAAVKIGLNTAEEIPGVGVLIGTARSLSNAGEALTAAMDAAAEVTATTADTVNATAQNWQRLQADKLATLSRTQKSIQQFTGGKGIK